MPLYECVFLARQDLSTAQVDQLTEQFSAVITGQGGQVTKVEPWGLRPLAYRIKKHRKAHYVLLNLDTPASAVIEVERQMRIHEDVLRYLTVKVEELEEGPSAVLLNRDRDKTDRPAPLGGRRRRDDDRGFDETILEEAVA